MNMKKYASLALAGLMATTVVSSAVVNNTVNAAKKAKTKIVFWHGWSGGELDALKAAVAKYEKKNKNVTIELLPVPFDKLQDKLKTTLLGSSGPDMFVGPLDWAGVFAQLKGGVLADVNTIKSLKTPLKSMSKSAVNALKIKGKQVGFPESTESVIMYYNKTKVKSVPKTWEDLVKVAKANTKGDNYGFVVDKNNYYHNRAFYAAQGGVEFTSGTTIGYTKPAFVNFLKFVDKTEKSGISPKTCDSATAKKLFSEGKAAFYLDGPWVEADLNKSSVKGKYGTMTIPKINGKTAKPFMGLKVLYVTKVSKNKEEVGKFISFLTSTDVAKDFEKAGHASANKKVKISDPVLKTVADQCDDAEPMPTIPEMGQVWQPVSDAMAAVRGGKAPAGEATKAADKIKGLIDQMHGN